MKNHHFTRENPHIENFLIFNNDQTETCLIAEGQVTVTDREGAAESVSFGPGDLVVFPVGLECVWKVAEPVKKHYNFS